MEKIDIVADQLQLDRALNKLIHNLVEESQLTLGETLSAWELCEKLSMQQFMALKKKCLFCGFAASSRDFAPPQADASRRWRGNQAG